MKTLLMLIGASTVLIACTVCGAPVEAGPDTASRGTSWRLQPSLKYDALCFLNVATGDPYYLEFYPDAHAQVEPQLTPAASRALADLKRKIKDERGNIISAFLTLYFSASDAETLADILEVVDDSEAMRERLRETPYYSEDGWALYESVRGELRTIFEFLIEGAFAERWSQELRPVALHRISQIEPRLPAFDVVGSVERVLGRPLSSNEITVYVLNYCKPHGIRITGTRFLTDVSWPFEIVVRNAVHEMMHPPYELEKDPELHEAIERWREDEFLMDRVLNHNPAFGYTTFEGYVEEDIIQAAEQIINERMGVAQDARRRWEQSDDGMHVLAAALYSVMTKEGFPDTGENLREFVLRAIRTGALGPGQVESTYREFYATMGG